MGLFWDLIQQSQISKQRGRADSIEERVSQLENELDETRQLLHKLVSILEKEYGKDIDGDGRVGRRAAQDNQSIHLTFSPLRYLMPGDFSRSAEPSCWR